jgi:hypothetical protein
MAWTNIGAVPGTTAALTNAPHKPLKMAGSIKLSIVVNIAHIIIAGALAWLGQPANPPTGFPYPYHCEQQAGEWSTGPHQLGVSSVDISATSSRKPCGVR